MKKAPNITLKTRLVGFAISLLVRGIGMTLRFRIDDPTGARTKLPEGPMIWAFWHNCIFAMPVFYRRRMPPRPSAVLTSASKDGAILAEAMRQLNVMSIRGSSSRRGAAAMVEMVKHIQRGIDVVITPDGPRGPCYKLQPGIIKLAQVTETPIFVVRTTYARAKRLRTWDNFNIPLPFSKVTVHLHPLQTIPQTGEDPEAFERERLAIEEMLGGD